MLSLFPALLDFGSIAPLLLRLALGGTFLSYGLRELIRPQTPAPNSSLSPRLIRLIGAWESLLGALLVVGLFTQIVALLIGLELLGYLVIRFKDKAKMPISADYLFVMLAIAISLMLLGSGLFAFDLPL
ncbi:MAG: DoxX family membrane protein [Candidatus Paceibacterota bacterium]|jgi:uncharacterized membrane protein YphA (DoxX/SURF4 family)